MLRPTPAEIETMWSQSSWDIHAFVDALDQWTTARKRQIAMNTIKNPRRPGFGTLPGEDVYAKAIHRMYLAGASPQSITRSLNIKFPGMNRGKMWRTSIVEGVIKRMGEK